jgi:hypothetical protein
MGVCRSARSVRHTRSTSIAVAPRPAVRHTRGAAGRSTAIARTRRGGASADVSQWFSALHPCERFSLPKQKNNPKPEASAFSSGLVDPVSSRAPGRGDKVTRARGHKSTRQAVRSAERSSPRPAGTSALARGLAWRHRDGHAVHQISCAAARTSRFLLEHVGHDDGHARTSGPRRRRASAVRRVAPA